MTMIRGAHILQKPRYHPKILGDIWAIRGVFDAEEAQISRAALRLCTPEFFF